MRFFIAIIVTGLLALVSGLIFPWWSIAVVAFIVSLLIPQSSRTAFVSGFLGIFLLWLLLAALINASNAGLLAGRVGQLLGIGENPVLLVLVTALVGGLVGGMASLTASYLKIRNR
ncbi:hypothetical protein GCM10027051_27440 [Niabella terrae]